MAEGEVMSIENAHDPRDRLLREKYFTLRPKPLERWLALAAGPATGRRARVLAALGRGHAKPRLVLPGAAQARGKPVLHRPFHGHPRLPAAQDTEPDPP